MKKPATIIPLIALMISACSDEPTTIDTKDNCSSNYAQDYNGIVDAATKTVDAIKGEDVNELDVLTKLYNLHERCNAFSEKHSLDLRCKALVNGKATYIGGDDLAPLCTNAATILNSESKNVSSSKITI